MVEFAVVKFWTEYRGDKATDYVTLAPRGEAFDRTKTDHRVSKLIPPEGLGRNEREAPTYIDMMAKWDVIGPLYRAWKEGLEIPEDGTPLAAWSGITKEQAEFVHRMGIKTVEDIRDMGESTWTKFPWPGASKLPKLAGDFLAGMKDADLADKLARAEERMAAMEEMLESAAAVQKPKPKRQPRKAKEDV